MNEPRHLDLVDRLRGQYHLPVNDGAGPLNGSMTFSREFPTPPIQKEAAAELERLSALWIAETRENERLRAALDRLGSSEAMTHSFSVDTSPAARELIARIDFARAALSTSDRGKP